MDKIVILGKTVIFPQVKLWNKTLFMSKNIWDLNFSTFAFIHFSNNVTQFMVTFYSIIFPLFILINIMIFFLFEDPINGYQSEQENKLLSF